MTYNHDQKQLRSEVENIHKQERQLTEEKKELTRGNERKKEKREGEVFQQQLLNLNGGLLVHRV